jgi:hypothetical protein
MTATFPILLCLRGLGIASNLGLGLLAAGLLSANDLGGWGLAMSAIAFGTLASQLGLGSSSARGLARAHFCEAEAAHHKERGRLLALGILGGSAGGLALWIVGHTLLAPAFASPSFASIIGLAAIQIPLLVVAIPLGEICRARGQHLAAVVGTGGGGPALAVSMIVLHRALGNPMEASTFLQASLIGSVASVTFLVWQVGSDLLPALKYAITGLPQMTDGAAMAWPSSVLYGALQQLDVVIVGILFDDPTTGAYALGSRLAYLLLIPATLHWQTISPRAARLIQRGKNRGVLHLAHENRAKLSIVTAGGWIGGTLVLGLGGDWLMPMRGNTMTTTYAILGAGICLGLAAGPGGPLLAWLGRLDRSLTPYLAAVAWTVLAGPIMARVMGPTGLAIAAASAFAATRWANTISANTCLLGRRLP